MSLSDNEIFTLVKNAWGEDNKCLMIISNPSKYMNIQDEILEFLEKRHQPMPAGVTITLDKKYMVEFKLRFFK